MKEKFFWQRSGHLPKPYTWLSAGFGDFPPIWASKRDGGGWTVQFAHRSSTIAAGKTRDEAAANLCKMHTKRSDAA